ncbi:MAG: hypothetical protein QOI41_3429 [Myxococcales bacterium]|nr:hypothetical protein [Myxococcales bacterium]
MAASTKAKSPAKARAKAKAPAKANAPVSKRGATPPPKSSKPEGRAARIAPTPAPRARVQRLPPSAPEAREGISPVAAKAIPPDPVANGAGSDGSRGKYVYCVIYGDKPLSFGSLGIGIDPADVHTVNFKDIAAVVSDTAIAVHEPTRANVLAHERVNETVMRDHTVIPMSFGTVFKTRDDIHELLRSAYDAFKDVLVKMDDKLEFGLKVLWDRDLIVKELENDNEDIRRLKGEITSQKGSTYFARMQYGRLVDAALQQRSEKYVHDIFEALRPVSVASRANKPIGDRMIMNAAFLVRRDKEEDFDAVVKRIGSQLDKLTFKYTGPWPPYNFVNIRLKLERA